MNICDELHTSCKKCTAAIMEEGIPVACKKEESEKRYAEKMIRQQRNANLPKNNEKF